MDQQDRIDKMFDGCMFVAVVWTLVVIGVVAFLAMLGIIGWALVQWGQSL